jgi:hypothetical protein
MIAVLRATGFALLLLACVGASPSAALTQAEKTVFYSGLNHDGEDSGHDAGAWVMVHTAFKDYEVWRGTSKCNSNRAVPRAPKRTFTRLVGYSAGRLGPAYYLQQMEQRNIKSDIRSVLLLDPGVADEFECDRNSGAGRTYATWLRQNANNRLVIITGGRSDDDEYKGLRETYLDQLTATTVGPNVGDRVLVCDAPSIKHTRVDEAWKHLIGASSLPKTCPAATTLSQYSPQSEPGTTSPPENPDDPNPGTGGSDTGPTPLQPPASAPVVVDNRVTNGASAMREDTPAYLSSATRNFCKRDGCALPGTDMSSGSAVTAECTTIGSRTTNGQDNSAIDDGNPGLYTSSRWYGVRWSDGRFGFVSEVWITAGYRGGLGLRGC